MFGSWVLEVAIGLIFVFLLFSTICAALREGIEAWTKTRAAYLERGVRELLHDQAGTGLAREFYEHPLIYSLYAATHYVPGTSQDKLRTCPGGGELPSYIPSKNFAAAMIDLAARGPLPNLFAGTQVVAPLSTTPVTAQSLRAGIGTMENKRVARALLNALDLAQDDLNKTRLNLEAWYDAGMDRVSGWYKRSTQWIVFWLGLVMAVVLNIDTIGIANFLYQNDTARHAVVQQVEAEVRLAAARPVPTSLDAAPGMAATPTATARTAAPDSTPVLTSQQKSDMARAKLDALNLPIGWESGAISCNLAESLRHCAGVRAVMVLGWIATALAATLGAPFWFDTLNKIMVIRSTVKPYEKSRPEGSEDRQNSDQSLTPLLRQLTAAGAPAQAGAAGTGIAAAPADLESDIDSCEPGHGSVTEDDQLPPGDGGVLR
jgi:hypothetical protein